MDGGDHLAGVAGGNNGLASGKICERNVGGVAIEGMGDQMSGRRLNLGKFDDLIEADAGPIGIKLGPFGDAVDVGRDLGLG